MSIVAISQGLGSLGDEIARALAETLSYGYADREIVLQAAEQFGQQVPTLEYATEGVPTLWERFAANRQGYLADVEAVIWELAARDNVVLVGRGATFVLREVRHAVRLRITAPPHLRARRAEAQSGFRSDAIGFVQQNDRERAARIKFLYDAAWDDPDRYDAVLNTEHLDVPGAVRIIQGMLALDRFRATPSSVALVRDRSVTARLETTLLRVRRSGSQSGAPRLLAVVRRGASERFRFLVEALTGLPALVVWDRRVAERRQRREPRAVDRRQREQRGPSPGTWDLAECCVVPELPRPSP